MMMSTIFQVLVIPVIAAALMIGILLLGDARRSSKSNDADYDDWGGI